MPIEINPPAKDLKVKPDAGALSIVGLRKLIAFFWITFVGFVLDLILIFTGKEITFDTKFFLIVFAVYFGVKELMPVLFGNKGGKE